MGVDELLDVSKRIMNTVIGRIGGDVMELQLEKRRTKIIINYKVGTFYYITSSMIFHFLSVS